MDETQALELARVTELTRTAAEATEQRYQAIEAAQDAGCTNVQIARAAGISERGIYKLLERRRNKRG